MTNKDPAFLFYSSDFLTGVMDLTMEERGQYITLLCLQHQKGHLSEKTICLSVGNVSVDVLKKFKKDSDGLLYNERVDDEIQKRVRYAESRRKNGSFGGRPKKQETKPYAKPYAKPYGKPTENHTENENEIENENINEDENLIYFGKYKITENFNILKIPDVEIYVKEVGEAIVLEVEAWLKKKMLGKLVDKTFICQQIYNFSLRNGLVGEK